MIGSPPSISMNPNFVIVCISYNMSCVKYYAGSLVKNVPGYQLGLWNNFIWNNCRWIISSRGWSTILHVRVLKLWCSPSTYPGIIRFWFHIDFKWSNIQLYRTILRMFHFSIYSLYVFHIPFISFQRTLNGPSANGWERASVWFLLVFHVSPVSGLVWWLWP